MRWMEVGALLLLGTAHAQNSHLPDATEPVVGPAQADNAMLFSVSNRVSAARSSCTVLVLSQWKPDAYMFNGVLFDVSATPDSGGFSEPQRLLAGPGTRDGEVAPDGDAVTEILSGQLCFFDPPCDPGKCPNPQPVWQVTWSTDDFTPRIVDLATLTAKFELFIDNDCNSKSFLNELTEGAGQIIVTCPADCDQSTGLGVLDLFDFLCFVNEFNAESHDADCDGDGAFSLFDFLCFVNEFNAGC